LFGLRHGAAYDHIFDLALVDLRHTRQRAADGDRTQIIGTRRRRVPL